MPPQNNRMEPASMTISATQGLGGPADDFGRTRRRRRPFRCRVGSDDFDVLLPGLTERCFIVECEWLVSQACIVSRPWAGFNASLSCVIF